MSSVHFGLAVLAGFIAGYLMAMMAFWMEGLLGVPRLDFGQAGMKFLGGERAGWWRSRWGRI